MLTNQIYIMVSTNAMQILQIRLLSHQMEPYSNARLEISQIIQQMGFLKLMALYNGTHLILIDYVKQLLKMTTVFIVDSFQLVGGRVAKNYLNTAKTSLKKYATGREYVKQ